MLKRAGQLLPLVARTTASEGAAEQLQQLRSINFFTAPNGPSVKQVKIEDEWYNRQRNLFPLLDKVPYYPVDVFIAPNAVVCGDVDIYGGVRRHGPLARWNPAASSQAPCSAVASCDCKAFTSMRRLCVAMAALLSTSFVCVCRRRCSSAPCCAAT